MHMASSHVHTVRRTDLLEGEARTGTPMKKRAFFVLPPPPNRQQWYAQLEYLHIACTFLLSWKFIKRVCCWFGPPLFKKKMLQPIFQTRQFLFSLGGCKLKGGGWRGGDTNEIEDLAGQGLQERRKRNYVRLSLSLPASIAVCVQVFVNVVVVANHATSQIVQLLSSLTRFWRTVLSAFPTNNALLTNFRPSSDAEIFVKNHRLSIKIGGQTCKNVYALSFHFACHHWWLGSPSCISFSSLFPALARQKEDFFATALLFSSSTLRMQFFGV